MNLTGPNNLKKLQPNVDHIIEEIENKFKFLNFIENEDDHVTLWIKRHTYEELNLVVHKYIANGWRHVYYTDYLITTPDKGHIITFLK